MISRKNLFITELWCEEKHNSKNKEKQIKGMTTLTKALLLVLSRQPPHWESDSQHDSEGSLSTLKEIQCEP